MLSTDVKRTLKHPVVPLFTATVDDRNTFADRDNAQTCISVGLFQTEFPSPPLFSGQLYVFILTRTLVRTSQHADKIHWSEMLIDVKRIG